MRQTNNRAVELIKKFEGFSSEPYVCPAGKLTIGYGHVIKPHIDTVLFGDIRNLTEGIDEWQGEIILKADLVNAENAVNRQITSALTENQFGALVSFVFNLGSGRLQSSTLRMKLNRGDYEGAANELLKWCKGGGRTLKGLVLRRQAERVLFLS